MLTPPESGESPIMGPREAGKFASVNGRGCVPNGYTTFAAANAYQAQTLQQRQNIVEGVWNRLAVDGNRSRDLSTTSAGPPHGHGTHPAESKGAVDQQVANANQAAVDRQISVEVAKLVATFRSDDAGSEEIPQPNNSIPYRGLDYDGLRALRQYVYGEEHGVGVDEEALLNSLEKTWRERVRADYQKMVENIPVFIARERAFLTWVELKRHLAALQRANERKSTISSPICTPSRTDNGCKCTGWSAEGHTTAEIERRIQQHRTLMGCTQTIIANFEDVGQGFGLGPNVAVDRDELLRQALVVLAGEKYAVEMQWKPIEFTATMAWLHEHLENFRREEEEDGKGMLWHAG